MGKFAVLCYILGVVILSKVNAYSKRWIWSTNWDDPKNWDNQVVPCSKDEIQLSEGALFVHKNMSLNSLVLSTNGEIIFGDSFQMTFSQGQKQPTDSKDCGATGKVVKFIRNKPKEWFNPLNWNFMENGKVANWSDGSLYMDRIPCKTDQVSFPQGDAFVVSVKGKAEVSEVFISQKSLSNVPAYLASKAGQLRFKVSGAGSLTANGRTCNQLFGCPCGYANMKETICASFECPPTCKVKVKPEGDCCERCGTLIKMNLNPRFSITSCQANLRKNLAKTDFKAATLVISPILDGNAVERVQILLTDKADGKNAVGAAQATLSYLQAGKDVSCDIYNAKIDTSNGGNGGGKSGKSTAGTGESSTIALAVTITLAVVLIILAALYLLYRRKKGPLFIRKQVLHNEMEISGSNTLNVEMTDTNFSGAVMGYDEDIMNVPGNFGASFENPMYDEMRKPGPAIIDPQQLSDTIEPITAKPVKKEKEKSEKSIFSKVKLKSKKKEGNDAFENPVYSEFRSDFNEVFDANDTFTVPDDVGYQNPLYGDLYAKEAGEDVVEVPSDLPPSFLDTIGFSPEDVDDAINSSFGTAGAEGSTENVDLGIGGGKGESEA